MWFGLGPQSVRKEAAAHGLKVFDATCPLVTKVHLEVSRLHRQGYEIVMIGHKGHPEVEGTMGQATGPMYLVESVDDVAPLKVGGDGTVPLAYVTQTTLSVDDAQVIVAALRIRFPDIVGPRKDDICYPLAAGDDYVHRSTSIKGSGIDAHEVLPGVHRVAALVKRWLLGTHQGSFSADHMQAYLDEFAFRFNRRGSRARGMLFYRLIEQSVAMHPITLQDLVANPRPQKAEQDRPAPPCSAKNAPSSLHAETPRSPWRR
jgi:hypothetical protein